METLGVKEEQRSTTDKMARRHLASRGEKLDTDCTGKNDMETNGGGLCPGVDALRLR